MKLHGLLPTSFGILCLLMANSCKKAQTNPKPNVLLICVDDLRPELKSFGANHIS